MYDIRSLDRNDDARSHEWPQRFVGLGDPGRDLQSNDYLLR